MPLSFQFLEVHSFISFFLNIYLWLSPPVSLLLCISQVSSKESLPMFNHHFFNAHTLSIYTKKQKSIIYHHSLCSLYDFRFHVVIYVLKPLRFFSTQVCFLLGTLVEQKNVIIQGTAIQVKSGDKHKIFLLRAKKLQIIENQSRKSGWGGKHQEPTKNPQMVWWRGLRVPCIMPVAAFPESSLAHTSHLEWELVLTSIFSFSHGNPSSAIYLLCFLIHDEVKSSW